MVTKIVGDVYLSDVNIIYNAVSVDQKDQRFSDRVRREYPEVYESYLNTVSYTPPTRVGEILLVGPVREKQFIFNGFIWGKKRELNMIAFVKTLVELHNLAEEYHLTVGFPKNFIKSKVWSKEIVHQIIEEVFQDSEAQAYIYE